MKTRIFTMLIVLIFIMNSMAYAYAYAYAGVTGEQRLEYTSSEKDPVDQVRSLLEDNYVDEVSEEVLQQETIEDMLNELEDPQTTHMSKEAYEDFMDSLDRTFSGIGVRFEMDPAGMMIISVIADGPAEKAGLLPGDIITEADGISMEGMSNEEVVSIVRGPQDTVVELEVERNGKVKEFRVTRDEISVDYVTGETLDSEIGYIKLTSFGSDTGTLFGEKAKKLNEEKWIMDLRNNPGGYLEGARDVLGYLTPGEVALATENQDMRINYTAMDHDFTLEDPLLVLMDRFTASASEIVAAALKDHEKALLLGETSYGKGTVQTMYELSDGSVLKMTTWHFFSPEGKAIEQKGVTPHIKLASEHLMKAAELLLSDSGHQLHIDGSDYNIDLEQARDLEYWPSYRALLKALEKEELWSHFYPQHEMISNLENVPSDKVYEIVFNQPIKPDTINQDTLRLVKANTGEEIDFETNFAAEDTVEVSPRKNLSSGKEYWLKINDGIESRTGHSLKQAVIANIVVE